MDPLQTRMATVGLCTLADHGFVLAGGYALRAHGFGTRDSDDIDLFTDQMDPDRFAQAVALLVDSYRALGLQTELARQAPLFARLVVDRVAKADLGVDHRQFFPVPMEVGLVLSEQDAVGSKVGAVYSRLEPRDFIDVQSVLDSGRYDYETLLALADQREATPLDRQMFAAQLSAGSRLPDAGFTRYRATPEQIARIRRTTTEWARRLTEGPLLGNNGFMSDEQPQAQPGDTYASMIPYIVPASLDLLQGPRTGVVELPSRLDWGPDSTYDLASIDDATTMYTKVISEASTEDDLSHYLNRDLLVVLWPRLRLPRRCAELWNRAFPQLSAAGPGNGSRR